MQRRSFLKLFTGVSLGAATGLGARLLNKPHWQFNQPAVDRKTKQVQLSLHHTEYVVIKNEQVTLPLSPSPDQSILIARAPGKEPKTDEQCPKICSVKHKIAGDNDPLIIDTLGNFLLVFKDEATGWVMG